MTARLETLARTPRLLVALDFDGTLAPLTDEPMAARMLPDAARAVSDLVATPETVVAFVSGRTLHDLRIIAEHDDASPILLAASHGAESWLGPDHVGDDDHDLEELALRDALRAEAEIAVSDVPGAWVEPKVFGFGVHTRLVRDGRAAEAHRRVDEMVAARAPHWRRRTGHSLIEYAFRIEGKDTAVAHLREITGATAVLFAGDDLTDEDALRSLRAGDVGIRVGDGDTAAGLRVADITELAAILHDLAHTRVAARE